MKKNLLTFRLLAALNVLLFSSVCAFSGSSRVDVSKDSYPPKHSLVIDVPEDAQPTKETVLYQCDTGAGKEKVEATYFNAGSIALVYFKWNDDYVVGANVIAASGAKYAGAQYIWWNSKNEVALYDLLKDPEEQKPILCVEEKASK